MVLVPPHTSRWRCRSDEN